MTLHEQFESALKDATEEFGLGKNYSAILSLVEKYISDEMPQAQFNSQLKNLIDSIETRS